MTKDEDFNDLVRECNGNEDYFAINYFCLRVSKYTSALNIFGVMTANNDGLTLYFLKRSSFKIKKENISEIVTLPYDTFTKLKVRSILFWNTIKIKYAVDGMKYRLNLLISNKVLGIRQQKENAKKLTSFLRGYKKEHKL